jgi:hypothetical protein
MSKLLTGIALIGCVLLLGCWVKQEIRQRPASDVEAVGLVQEGQA